MLDFILDIFIKHLHKDLASVNNLGNGGSPAHHLACSPDSRTPNVDENGAIEILTTKKNMIDVMSELMQLLSPDTSIRQFDDLRFIESLYQILHYTFALHRHQTAVPELIERQLRICIEIYLSKI